MSKSTLTLDFLCGIVLAAAIALFIFTVSAPKAEAVITYMAPLQPGRIVTHNFFTATTTTATSTNDSRTPANQTLRIEGAKKVTFAFSRSGPLGNQGSSKFDVEVSQDGGATWQEFSRMYLMDVAKTATTSVWITAATTTVHASMDLEMNTFRHARCIVDEVTDGQHTCSATAEY